MIMKSGDEKGHEDRFQKAEKILELTQDGNKLSGSHLWLVQEAVNNNLTDRGWEEFENLYLNATSPEGYKVPWFYGIENLTKDSQGWVRWKGIMIEHYSFHNMEKEKAAAEDLGDRCRRLEKAGYEVNIYNVIHGWDEYKKLC